MTHLCFHSNCYCVSWAVAVWSLVRSSPMMGNVNCCSLGMFLLIFWILFFQAGYLPLNFSLGVHLHPCQLSSMNVVSYFAVILKFYIWFFHGAGFHKDLPQYWKLLFVNAYYVHSLTGNTHSECTHTALIGSGESWFHSSNRHDMEGHLSSTFLNADVKVWT